MAMLLCIFKVLNLLEMHTGLKTSMSVSFV